MIPTPAKRTNDQFHANQHRSSQFSRSANQSSESENSDSESELEARMFAGANRRPPMLKSNRQEARIIVRQALVNDDCEAGGEKVCSVERTGFVANLQAHHHSEDHFCLGGRTEFLNDDEDDSDDVDLLDEEDEDYMRLDTIVEEDEESVMSQQSEQQKLAGFKNGPLTTAAGSGSALSKEPALSADVHLFDCNRAQQNQQRNRISTKASDADHKIGPQAERTVKTTSAQQHRESLVSSTAAPAQLDDACDIVANTCNVPKPNQNQCPNKQRQFNSYLNNHEEEFDCNSISFQNHQQSQHKTSGEKNFKTMQQHSQHLKAPLPSTNRLISEHQARQQQALFKALAERQKLLDECDSGERIDLMSSELLTTTESERNKLQRRQERKLRRRRRRRRRRLREANGTAGGQADEEIPLSAVDLSSMSDRMLDDLLGHIAPASSSSISSNESLHCLSSSNSNSSSGSDSDDSLASSSDNDNFKPARKTQATTSLLLNSIDDDNLCALSQSNQPNVIGIHEDERTRFEDFTRRENGKRRNSCRKSFEDEDKRNNQDDDDEQGDHELVVALNGQLDSMRQQSGSLMNNSNGSGSMSTPCDDSSRSSLFNGDDSNRTTSSDIIAKEESPCEGREQQQQQSIEGVLARMLEALNKIGPDNQEQLNDLLERGFSRLESLLNCSLANKTASSTVQRSQQHQQQPLEQLELKPASLRAQKMISTAQQQLFMSKDSDYGSDTQSAIEQQVHHLNQLHQQLESPSPTSIYTTSTESGSSMNPAPSGGAGRAPEAAPAGQEQQQPAGALSPMAIELSFHLAESLHRLAQRQQQLASRKLAEACEPGESESQLRPQAEPELQAKADGPAPRRQAMKSVVMINCPGEAGKATSASRSPSASSIVSSGATSVVSSLGSRNMKPSKAEETEADEQRVESATKTTTAAASKQLQQSPETISKRQPFKTCVNIGRDNQTQATGCNVSSVSLVARNDDLSGQRAGVNLNSNSSSNGKQQVVKVISNFERKRSARGSLRRRPSFSGSATGSIKEPGAPRPGSPVPRSAMQKAPAESSQQVEFIGKFQAHKEETQARENNNNQLKKEKQLQRAFVLAQKYNYSPAKLAASKLSSKLQLKELTATSQETKSPDTNNTAQALIGNSSNNNDNSQANGNGQSQRHQERSEQQAANSKSKGYCSIGNNNKTHQSESKIQITGKVQLDISYFAKSGSLTVHVIQCSQLAAIGKRRTSSNTYVKLYLLPDRNKSSKQKSSTIKNDLNPKFDQKFTFGPDLWLSQFHEKVLWLTVWHKESRRIGTRNDFLGELLLPLSQVRQQLFMSDLCQSTGSIWYELSEKFEPNSVPKLAPEVEPGQGRGGNQLELIEKLNEYRQKAARLSSVGLPVSPSMELKPNNRPDMSQLQQQKPTKQMNVILGPLSDNLAHNNSQSPITGQLFIALKFVPENGQLVSARNLNHLEGELHVMIKEAKNIAGFESPLIQAAAIESEGGDQPIRCLPSGPLPNPFCKCYLLAQDGSKLDKQKTPCLKRTANPNWDHNQLNEPLGGIRLCSAILDTTQSDRNLAQLSPDDSQSIHSSSTSGGAQSQHQTWAAGEQLCGLRESKLWAQMLARPNIWVYGELPLRSLRPLISLKN